MTGSALITGASRGIGLAVATRLAGLGYGLTLTARDPDRLDAVAADLRLQIQVVTVAADIADPETPERLVAAHEAAFGTMRALVLNAGVGTAGPIGEFPQRRFDKTVAVNLGAPFALVRHALPLLRKAAVADPAHGAKVVGLSSITGVYAERGLAAYGATKAALISLMGTLSAEESGNGVTATAIAPAYVDTDMSDWIKDTIPAESMIATNDIVELVDALLRMSARAVVPSIVVTRAGASPYGA
ncbi:MAG TPA: SDR family oxidoreductase [Aldersonia sp.]